MSTPSGEHLWIEAESSENLSQLEWLGISADILRKIDEAGKRDELKGDILKIQDDPTQAEAFKEKYLKGYWQIVQLKDGTIYTYSQLLEIWKKDPNKEDAILAELPEETEEIYTKWKLSSKWQAVNQKWLVSAWLDKEVNQLDTWIALKKQEVNQKWLVSAWLDQEVNQKWLVSAWLDQEVNQLDTWIALKKQEVNQKWLVSAWLDQEVNQKWLVSAWLDKEVTNKTEQLINLERITKEGVDKARALLGNKFPNISKEDSQKIAQEIPELKWVNSENLGQYSNIITAYYLVQNQDSIASTLDDKTRKEFLNITRELNWAFSEGIKQKLVSYDKKVDSLILWHGTHADDIKVRGSEWIKQWYTEVRYDGNAREFSFRNESGVTKKIQLRWQIAQESTEKNGLRITRELVPWNEKVKEFERKFWIYKDSVKKLILSSPNDPITPEIDSTLAWDVKNDFEIAKKNEGVWDILWWLENTEKWLKKKIALLSEMEEKMSKDNETNEANNIKWKIWLIEKKIEVVWNEIKKLIEFKREESELKKERNTDSFDKNAEDTMKTLVWLGYDELGQWVLDRVIRIINLRNKWEVGKIDPTLNTPLTPVQKRELTLAITNMARNARIDKKEPGEPQKSEEVESSRQSWQWVDQTDPIIAYRQTQSGLWRETLQSLRWAFQSGWSLERDTSLLKAIYRDTDVPDMTPNIALNTTTTNRESQVA
jgi:hypothetical protein